MADTKAKLTPSGDMAVGLDVLNGTLGQDVIDTHTLGSKGMFTLDSGFASTALRGSKTTFIDGDEGILLCCGFPIDQLAIDSNYLEVYYILSNGEKPTQEQHNKFKTTVTRHTMIHEQITRLFHAFRRDSHPTAVMCDITGALAVFHHDLLDVNNLHHREVAMFRLLSKMPTMAAMCYKYSVGQPFVYPRNDLFYAGNFLNVTFSTLCEPYEVNPISGHATDRILILYADHEQNASTSTVRTAGPSGTNPLVCIVAGIALLWRSVHGGANEVALKMLEEISSVKYILEFVRRAKGKNDSFRPVGFGHRVYKNHDLRAIVMREICHEVLKELGTKDDLLEVATELENIAPNDPCSIEKKLYLNADFCLGIILRVMGVPSSVFTVTFTMVRTVSWVTHWSEMYSDDMKIARPCQLYTGYEKRNLKSDIKRQWLITKPLTFRVRFQQSGFSLYN